MFKTMCVIAKIFTASLIVLFASCNASKETVQEVNVNTMDNEQSDNKAMDANMSNEGFHIGEIKHLRDSKCSYIIINKTTNAKLDPINISDDSYKSLRNDGEKIYFKYRPLRRMNRCTEANPIEITDIKKREG